LTLETEEETIARRQRNADSFFGCLLSPWGCLPSLALIVLVVPYWVI